MTKTMRRLPRRTLLSGDETGAGSSRHLPAFEQPACAIRIGGQTGGIAAYAAVHSLDHQRIRKAHRPFDAVNFECESRTVRAVQRGERHGVDISGNVGKKSVNADMAKSGSLRVEPEVIRRVEKVVQRSCRMRPRQRQVRIAVAIGVAGTTRELRIAEWNEFGDRRDAAILHADFFQMRAAIVLLVNPLLVL